MGGFAPPLLLAALLGAEPPDLFSFRSFLSLRPAAYPLEQGPLADRTELRQRLYLEGRFGADRFTVVGAGKLDDEEILGGYAPANRFSPELREAYAEFQWGPVDLAAGNQIKSWGITDGSPLDVVNPKDLTEFLFNEKEFLKVPVPMASAGLDAGGTVLEAVFLPFYRPAHFYPSGRNWALLPSFFLTGTHADLSPFASGSVDMVEEDFPRPLDFSPQAGIGWKGTLGGVDVSAVYFSGEEPLPVPELNPVFLDLFKRARLGEGKSAEDMIDELFPMSVSRYATYTQGSPFERLAPRRFDLVGAGAQTNLRGWLLKADAALVPNQRLLDQNLEIVEAPLLTPTVQVERSFPYDLVVILPVTMPTVFTSDDLFVLKAFNPTVSALLRWSLLEDRLLTETGGSYDAVGGSHLVSETVTYTLGGTARVWAGANLLGGRRASLFGFYRDNTQVFAGLRYYLL